MTPSYVGGRCPRIYSFDGTGIGVLVISGLTGPAVTDPQACPPSAFADVTAKPCTWTLTGPAAGVSALSTRLLVLDF